MRHTPEANSTIHLQDTHSYIKYQPGILEDAWFFIISCIAMLYHQPSPTFS